jgi:hypothetical protein
MDRHPELADEKHRAALRIDRQDRGAVAAVVDLAHLPLDDSVAARDVEGDFPESSPIVGQQLVGMDLYRGRQVGPLENAGRASRTSAADLSYSTCRKLVKELRLEKRHCDRSAAMMCIWPVI